MEKLYLISYNFYYYYNVYDVYGMDEKCKII